jgi:hypothetical protein
MDPAQAAVEVRAAAQIPEVVPLREARPLAPLRVRPRDQVRERPAAVAVVDDRTDQTSLHSALTKSALKEGSHWSLLFTFKIALLAKQDSGVTDDRAGVTGNIRGRRVFDEFRVLHSDQVERGKQRDCRPETTHGNIVLAANVKESARIEAQDLFDGQMIFPARSSVIFIVVAVRSSEQKNVGIRQENFPERLPDGH